MDCTSVAEFLNDELTRRKLRNSSYSLRAFARDLQMSPSRLSEILKQNAGLSEKSADTISARLELKRSERLFFTDLALAAAARDKKVRALAKDRLSALRRADSVRRLKDEQFKVISDWYHGAIAELTQLTTFQSDPAWIARQLGISTLQASEAIERLIHLGILSRAPDGEISANAEACMTISDTPSSAIRKFHRQIIMMAMQSTIEDATAERELFAAVVAIPAKKLPEFREQMMKFIDDFWHSIEHDPKDKLYALSLQLCPVKNRRRTKSAPST
jgi:uncharacterized protein (TIGR02147 family)